MLQQVCHFKVDVIAGDANAAAYKYYKKQEYQDLFNSSVAIRLREVQREVSMGPPFENKLHIDFSTNNHPTQLHAGNDIDCCGKASRTLNYETGLSMNLREQTYCRQKGKQQRRRFA